ncbi:MAG: PhzA/PhzB family protein [Bacteroidales bacterium]|nr:PhzA/PhzB family protein [Bacteroidales bacterium]
MKYEQLFRKNSWCMQCVPDWVWMGLCIYSSTSTS